MVPVLKRFARKVLRRLRTSEHASLRWFYATLRGAYRSVFGLLPHRYPGWRATLRRAHWAHEDGAREDGHEAEFVIAGWAYMRGFGYRDTPPAISVWAESRAGGHRIDGAVTHVHDIDVNATERSAEFDYANTAFRAVFDLRPLLDHAGDAKIAEGGWVVKVAVSGAGKSSTGPFVRRYRWSSAAALAVRTFADRTQIGAKWDRDRGLLFWCREPRAWAGSIDIDEREVQVEVHTAGLGAVRAAAFSSIGRDELDATLETVGADTVSIRATILATGHISELFEGRGNAPDHTAWDLHLIDDADSRHPVQVTEADIDTQAPGARTPLLMRASSSGQLQIVDIDHHMEVRGVRVVTEPRTGVEFVGTHSGLLPTTALAFEGSRLTIPVEITEWSANAFSAFAPLWVSVWDGPQLPPTPGGYRLRGATADGEVFDPLVSQVLAETLYEKHSLEGFRLKVEMTRYRGLRLRVGVERRDDELGSFHQTRLLDTYRLADFEPTEAVYFESFYGRKSTCNPHAIDAEIARHHPDLIRYWGIADRSVSVPDGAIAVVEGTREWWQARGTARYVVVNDWIRAKFKKQPFQTLLQTWHGSMYKRIGLDRKVTRRRRKSTLLERNKWDLLLSQNPHSTPILERAYEFDRPIIEEGYPRNDSLVGGDGTATRAKLRIAPTTTVLLYAPTWREPSQASGELLDLETFAKNLDGDYLVLRRAHTRTLAVGEKANARHDGVLDVSTYPEISDLFLAADVLITDYSSMMFDFSATGKPMIFFAPDIDEYRDTKVRGVYFDLAEVAPGPVVLTADALVDAVHNLPVDVPKFAEKYEQWQAQFNAYDDGHSAERVASILLSHRPTTAADANTDEVDELEE